MEGKTVGVMCGDKKFVSLLNDDYTLITGTVL